MAQVLEKRVEELEKQVAKLAALLIERKVLVNAWQETFGLSRDDDGFREMVQLGREYRQTLDKPNNSAGS
jgi:hypothetical protein